MSARPLPPLVFIKKYSVQLGFCLILVTFLTASVGEGQAYEVGAFDLVGETIENPDGFIGKPQIFAGQTVLTGEIQQAVAIVYRVEQGDTMIGIANRYNLNVGSILDANNMKALEAEKIRLGTELIIPAEDTNTSLAWLEAINIEKERQRQLAEAARQRELAQRNQSRLGLGGTRAVQYGDYTILGRRVGSYNGGYPGQCTWLVNSYYRFPGRMGNGGQYLVSARAYGIPTGNTPVVGAVIVTTESYYGHIGIVKAVEGDKVIIEDMNYAGPYIVTRRALSRYNSVIKGYVYMR